MSTATRWRLESITIRGFRGIDREQTFDLAGKPALFCGNNGVGKSTIALALQWTLFGRFPDGVLSNRGFKQFLPPVAANAGKPCAEVSFRSGSQRLVIRRDDEAQKFTVKLGGDVWEDEEADTQRDAILGVDCDAFVRTVLLHQTRTRGLLLDDAKSRNHAIDMLLGVEAAQKLYEILKPKRFLDAAEKRRREIAKEQDRYEAQRELLEAQLEDATKHARELGFGDRDFKWQALRARYKTLALDVAQLAVRHNVPGVDSDAPEDLDQARPFAATVTQALGEIQVKGSVQSRLVAARGQLGRLEALNEQWTELMDQRNGTLKELEEAERKHGKAEQLVGERKQLNDEIARLDRERKTLNELHRLLADARSYIDQHHSKSCPVCEQRVELPELAAVLDKRIEILKSKEVRAKEKDIKARENRLRELENAETEIGRLGKQVDRFQKDVDRLLPKIATALQLDSIVQARVQQRLASAISGSNAECQRLEKEAASVLDQIKDLSSKVADLNTSLLPVLEKRCELEAHEAQRKRSQERHADVNKRADEMEAIAARLERIQNALLDGKEKLASERLARARPRALAIYEHLVRHPRFNTFKITATPMARKVEYNFEVSIGGENGTEREARLVLSEGQVTATAIGVFIGLAESAGQPLDLVFIDDPTQNVDLPCKKAMAQLMTEIAQQKQVVLSTHDEDFVGYLQERGFHKKAAVFTLQQWDGNPKVVTSPLAGPA